MVANVKSSWRSGNLVFEHVVSGAAIHYGISGTGLDVKFWGDTASVYMMWDYSADNWVCASQTHIDMAADKAMLIFKAGSACGDSPTADAETGWLNAYITSETATNLVYIPYYTT